jgi:hypothetical protein
MAVGAGEAPGEVPRVRALHPRPLSGLRAAARSSSRGQRGKNNPRFIEDSFYSFKTFSRVTFSHFGTKSFNSSVAKIAHQKRKKTKKFNVLMKRFSLELESLHVGEIHCILQTKILVFNCISFSCTKEPRSVPGFRKNPDLDSMNLD